MKKDGKLSEGGHGWHPKSVCSLTITCILSLGPGKMAGEVGNGLSAFSIINVTWVVKRDTDTLVLRNTLLSSGHPCPVHRVGPGSTMGQRAVGAAIPERSSSLTNI